MTDVIADPVSPPEPPPREADAAEDVLRLAEALIFASAEPVSSRALSQALPDDVEAEAVIAALETRYAERGVVLARAGGGVMFRTADDLAPRLRRVVPVARKLSRAAMETLAVIAYHQPCTRPEIEEIRGVTLSQLVLDALLEANLIAPGGRRETPGRPTLWKTTPAFLAQFGLNDIRELPSREDLFVDPAARIGAVGAPNPEEAPQEDIPDASPVSEQDPPC